MEFDVDSEDRAALTIQNSVVSFVPRISKVFKRKIARTHPSFVDLLESAFRENAEEELTEHGTGLGQSLFREGTLRIHAEDRTDRVERGGKSEKALWNGPGGSGDLCCLFSRSADAESLVRSRKRR